MSSKLGWVHVCTEGAGKCSLLTKPTTPVPVECIAMDFKTHGDRRWWLAPHAICYSSQAAKQRCSADERKILVVVTWTHTVKATRYSVPQFHNMFSYSLTTCSERNSGFEGRGACMSTTQLWLEVCWIPNSWGEIPI